MTPAELRVLRANIAQEIHRSSCSCPNGAGTPREWVAATAVLALLERQGRSKNLAVPAPLHRRIELGLAVCARDLPCAPRPKEGSMINAHSSKAEILDALNETLKREAIQDRKLAIYEDLKDVVKEFLLVTPQSIRPLSLICSPCRRELGQAAGSRASLCRWHKAEMALKMLDEIQSEEES